jgi:serine/threonine protein kinase
MSNEGPDKREMLNNKTREEPNKIGRYEIRSKIGDGGFGEVFRVYDPDLDVERAIKVPFSQGGHIERALQEARNQARVSHPAILRVYDVEQVDGKWAIIMEYASGGSLRERIEKEGRLSVEESLEQIENLANALAEAHRKNILHYDIKPENILFDDRGHAKLGDFGISRRIEQEGKKVSRVTGTIQYMGPEQLNGIEDKRSEIWSLGAVLYEMLTGRACFEGATDAQIIDRIRRADFVAIEKVNTDVPKEVLAILSQMLTLDPAERYQNMNHLVEDLRGLREGDTAKLKSPLGKWVILLLAVNVFISTAGGLIYAHRTEILNLGFFDRIRAIETVPIPESINALDPGQQFLEARTHIEKGEYQLAYQILKKVEETAENKSLKEKACFYKASLALNYMKEIDLALSEFKSYLEKYPAGEFAGEAHYFLGGIYYEQRNDLHKAIQHLTTVVEKYPQSAHIQTAEFLIQDAAKQLAAEEKGPVDTVKSVLQGFLPNNWVSLLISLLGLISAIAIPIAALMAPMGGGAEGKEGAGGGWSRYIRRHKMLEKKLILIVIISQIMSFTLTQYQNLLDQQRSKGALERIGISVGKR